MHKRTTAFVITAILWLGLLGSFGTPSASAASPSKPGMGSTVKSWTKIYGVKHGPGDVCAAKNSCFGPSLRNPESGRTYGISRMSLLPME